MVLAFAHLPTLFTAPLALALDEQAPALTVAWWDYFYWTVHFSGPTLIKFMQWASSRRDMFSEKFCNRFQKLQDRTPPHALKHTIASLEEALGPGWRDLLRIDSTPVGSGCIAQVYHGHLKAGTSGQEGREVAVKVVHPGVGGEYGTVAVDLELLRAACSAIHWLVPSMTWIR
jgi:aarF domain-containing kinase